MKDENEIRDQIDKATEQIDKGGTKWRGETYEDGVYAALSWVLGEQAEGPMEDE